MKHITDKPIRPGGILSSVDNPKAGAIVLFSGEVRNHNDNREVLYLEYEAHEIMAEAGIEKILKAAKSNWDIHDAFCIHRIGRVDIGESSVVVITTASHREEAYAANRFIINELKKDVPIWKKEFFADGNNEWK